jgi:hypothetical protein
MENILRELFGTRDEEPVAAPAAAPAAETATPDKQSTRAAEREARRAARQQRKADPDRRKNRTEFVERYTTGNPSEGFSSEEAIAHLAEIREELSPAEFRRALAKTLENLPADQRDEFIAMMRKHQAGAGAAGATAAGAAGTAAAPAASSDPFGGLLAGLLGGNTAPGAPDAGSLLDDLRSGGLKAPSRPISRR